MSVAMVENGIYSDYRSPLATRYVSKEMRYNFSDQQKFSTWRKLWIYLAKAEMLEECGTCDEAGNVEIKKGFLMPMKPRKCSARPKPKLTDKRSTPNNSLKSVPKTAPKSPDCPPNPCTLEQCQSDYLTWQTSFQMEHRNRTKQNVVQLLDVNGNSKTALDQYLHYENLKKNGVQNQLSVIIPLISSFLKKRKGPRTLKPDEARRQIVVENPPDAIFMNNYAGNCQYPPRDKKLVPETRNPNWNSADNVTSKVSRVLPMSDKNQRQIMPANNAGSMVNVPAGHAPVHPNQYPFANHVQYGNYYQNYTVGGMKQNDPTTSGHLACEIPGQCNAYDARPSSVYHQEPSRNHFSQQFCNVADSCVNLGYPYSTSNQECENRGFPELNNRIYYHTTEPQNACDIAYCDNEISRGSIFSSMQNFDDAYTYMAPRTSAMFRNDGIFRGNEQSNEYRV